MKTKRLLTFLVLLSMSFSIVHAYAIDMLDTHDCKVSEYVQEFSQSLNDDIKGDVCHIHYGFHSSYIIPDIISINKEKNSNEKPSSLVQSYEYNSYDNFLKPPITL